MSDVDLDQPLGRPEDLLTHEELLDTSAAEVPVLPLRFGSVAASDEVVAAELLAPRHDEFASALRRLDGHAEYVVRGRYDKDAVLREVLTENPRAAQLCDQIQGTSPDSLRDLRMELAEIVVDVIAASASRTPARPATPPRTSSRAAPSGSPRTSSTPSTSPSW